MRQILIPICFALCLVLFSCDKKDDLKVPTELPEWMQQKVSEVITDQKLCSITNVTIFQYKNDLYYHLYCGLWSCMYCHLYNSKGEKVDGNSIDFEAFLKEKKELQTIPACP